MSSSVIGPAAAGSGSGVRWSKLLPPPLRRDAPRELPAKSPPPPFAPAAQENQITGHDFGHVFLLAGGLVVPGAGLQASFDVDLAALLQIFAGDLRQALPEHDVVPLGAVLPFAGFVFEALVGGDGQLGYRRALGVYLISGSLPRLPIS